MPRITALNILTQEEGKEYLSELYGKVIENVMKNLTSGRIKNMDLSGDPVSGSVEAKRFVNAKSQKYGTARAAGAGNAVCGHRLVGRCRCGAFHRYDNDGRFCVRLAVCVHSVLFHLQYD